MSSLVGAGTMCAFSSAVEVGIEEHLIITHVGVGFCSQGPLIVVGFEGGFPYRIYCDLMEFSQLELLFQFYS